MMTGFGMRQVRFRMALLRVLSVCRGVGLYVDSDRAGFA